jgi:hypothetical protein
MKNKKKRDRGIAFGKIWTKEDDGFWSIEFRFLPSITLYLNGYKFKGGVDDYQLTFSWLLWYVQLYSFEVEDWEDEV